MARPRSEAARDKMVAAATEVILDRGIGGFTIDEVAKRSGVAKTTIYRHFPETDDLVMTAVDATIDYAELPDTGSLRGDLAEFLRRVRPNFIDTRNRAVHYELWAAQVRNPSLAERAERNVGPHRSVIPDIVARWKAAGEINPGVDLLTAFEIINGPFAFRSITAPDSLAHIDIDALVERMVVQLQMGTARIESARDVGNRHEADG